MQISDDGGENWYIIYPNEGYPDNSVIALTGKPGFTGDSEGWQREEFDLTEYTNQIVQFRLRFATTNSNDKGWFIDNFTVNGGSMALATPNNFVASAAGTNVNLSWTQPITELEYVGFNLYRKCDGEEFGEPIAELDENVFFYTDYNLEEGYYTYGLTAIYANSLESQKVTAIAQINSSVDNKLEITTPKYYSLSQNYPNPFNPTTIIKYALPQRTQISIKIYDITGKLIKTLIDKPMEAGYHTILWDGTDEKGKHVSSGVFYYKIYATDFQQIKSMILLK